MTEASSEDYITALLQFALLIFSIRIQFFLSSFLIFLLFLLSFSHTFSLPSILLMVPFLFCCYTHGHGMRGLGTILRPTWGEKEIEIELERLDNFSLIM